MGESVATFDCAGVTWCRTSIPPGSEVWIALTMLFPTVELDASRDDIEYEAEILAAMTFINRCLIQSGRLSGNRRDGRPLGGCALRYTHVLEHHAHRKAGSVIPVGGPCGCRPVHRERGRESCRGRVGKSGWS